MPSHTRARLTLWLAFCLALLACRSDSGEAGMTHDESVRSESRGSLILDLETQTVTQAVGAELARSALQKFVQIEITEVHNPKKLRVIFEVHYRLENGEETLLGSFSLFPPDNPGDFIVATRGELRNEGEIVVSMQVLDEVEPEDELRVTMEQISFREE